MTPFQPFMVARYGVYLAIVVAAGSVWLGQRAGATFDYALLRAVFVFVIFAVLAFGAEAVLTIGWQPRPAQPEPLPQQRPSEDEDDE